MKIKVYGVKKPVGVFSGRVRLRVEPLDTRGQNMFGSKSLIVEETTVDELFNLLHSSIKSKEE